MTFDAAIDQLRATTGGVFQFPRGITDITSPITLDYRDATSDIHTDPRQVAIRGERMGTTVLRNLTSGAAISIIGDDAAGNGWGAIAYEGIEDLAFTGSGTGLRAQEIAFANFRNLMFRGMPLAMDLESVLSTELHRIYITGGVDGIRAYKGSGFSDHNANKLSSCEFRLGSGVAFKSGPASGLWFDNLTVQGWGTHGDPETGGVDLSFTGHEGGVGLKIDGGYFEVNGGGFDIRLTNLGTEMITHVISGVNFNRISMAKHVWANIVLRGGPQTVVLIGCNFKGYDDGIDPAAVPNYVPSADRPTISRNKALHKIVNVGSYPGDPIESDWASEGLTIRDFAFRVSASGAITGPSGWSVSKLAPGVTRVTHNLGIPSGLYGFQATVTDSNSGFVLHTFPQANYVDVVTGMDFLNPADRGFAGHLSLL